jgi:hypothetical protein
MRRDASIGEIDFGYPQRQVFPDLEMQVRERDLAGRPLGAKPLNS